MCKFLIPTSVKTRPGLRPSGATVRKVRIEMTSANEFTDDLFTSLGIINTSIEYLMIQFIYVLKNTNVNENAKQSIRGDIIEIGNELNSFYLLINKEKIGKYDAKAIEKRIIDKNREVKNKIDRIMESINKRKEIILDSKIRFSIKEIINQLSDIKILNEYAIAKDKIDNLFAVKKFIVELYENQFAATIANEKKNEKKFYELKLKTFLDMLRNAIANNPEYFFKTLELIKKLISAGKKVEIANEENQKDVIKVKLVEENCIEYEYMYNGIAIKARVKKRLNDSNCQYEINGMIGKGSSEVIYSIGLATIDKKIEQIEHLLGFDYLWAYYEKAYLDYHSKIADATTKYDKINKDIIDKAIDDLLFS
jgi:hypothetical protein